MSNNDLKKMIKYFIITLLFVLFTGLSLRVLRNILANSSPYVTVFVCVALMGVTLAGIACAGSSTRRN